MKPLSRRSKILILTFVVFVVIQLFRIDKTNPPVHSEDNFVEIYQTPDSLQTLIKNACYDCHSNESIYPWYAEVAPISWVIKGHINEGREHLNFSDFGKYNKDQMEHVLMEAAEQLEKGKMPMRSYVNFHEEANLSEAERQALIDYFETIKKSIDENESE